MQSAVRHSVLTILIMSAIMLYGDATAAPQATGETELARHDREGTAAYNRADYTAAISHFTRSLELCERQWGPGTMQSAYRHRSIALACNYLARYDCADEHYASALAVFEKQEAAGALDAAMVYHGMGLTAQYRGQFARAIEQYNRALDTYQRLLDEGHPTIAQLFYDRGVAYQYQGDYDNAMEHFTRALDMVTKKGNADSVAAGTFHYSIGEIHKHQGRYGQALDESRHALAIYRKHLGEEHTSVATACYAIAYLYDQRGEYDTSLSYYERARTIYTAAYGENHPHTAMASHGMGVTCVSAGDFDRAVELFTRAITAYQSNVGDEHMNTAASYHGLGLAYQGLGYHEKAIESFQKTLAIHLKVLGPKHPDTASSYRDTGLVYRRRGDTAAALANYRKALDIYLTAYGQDHPIVAHCYNLMGSALLTREDTLPQAREHFTRSLAIAKKLGLRQLTVECSELLGSLHMYLQEFAKARTYYDGALGAIEKARVEAGAGRLEYLRRNIGSYYSSLRASAELGDLDAVFATAEAMKARGFIERLSLAAALSTEGITPADRTRMIVLNDEIESLALRRSAEIARPLQQQDGARIAALSRRLEGAEGEFAAIDERLLGIERYRSLRRPRLATLAQARKIAGESVVLEYVIWDRAVAAGTENPHARSYCLVIKKTGARLIPLDSEFDYTGAVRNYRETLIGGDKQLRDAAAILYCKLIEPVAADLAGTRSLIIIPDGALAFLPFDALRKDPASKYLGQQFDITLCPSVTVLGMVGARPITGPASTMLALGGARYAETKGVERARRTHPATRALSIREKASRIPARDEGDAAAYYLNLGIRWDNLPGTLAEVLAIERGVFGPRTVRILSGNAATEAKLKELSKTNELARYRTLHLACHGYYDPDYPAYSAVVLSEASGLLKSGEDGYLSLPEVALLKLRADIVNLSACETGLGKIMQGDGIVGLTRSFMEAGSNRVVVTLWQVADGPTKEFMVSFYTKVHRGKMSYARALAETKREFMKSAAHNDPYFWGAFVLYGPGN